MSRKKKPQQLSNVLIESYAAEGKCISRLEDGKVLFVEQAIPGDVVDVLLKKNKSSYAEGRVTRLVEPSPLRVTPFCQHFGVCGGCKWQMLPYEQQLAFKQQQVQDQLQRIGQVALPELEPIRGSRLEKYYRNKLEFTFSNHRYRTHEELVAAGGAKLEPEPGLGFHAPGLFDKVVPIYTCYLQGDPTNKLLAVLRRYSEEHGFSYYDFHKQEGWLRNAMIRVSTLGEVLVNLIVKENKPELFPMLDHLLAEIPEITSLHYTINPKVNDTIHDLEVHCYKGKGFIMETLDEFSFKISPKSFFQTNPTQAAELYRITREFAGLTGDEVVYDLYCGTGSIGIFCSGNIRSLIGIELIPEAIEDAKENAALNGIGNAHFFAGDVASICTPEFFEKYGRPDVVITDPPRAGMHEDLIRQLKELRPPKIVYVSCNPATQARDLKLLDECYTVERLQPVDMFPHTHHIENVALLRSRL